jgi:Fanconi anemia group M protein
VTVELTGTVQTHLREKLWKSKNLLFMTPETFRNDIQTGVCPSEDVVLVVFDEAHRASGNYAYCDIIREMTTKENVFRVLALSATPGSDGGKVQDVVNNLLIQQLQLRTEESDDVVPFIFKRSINEVVLEPSPLLIELTNDFAAIIQPYLKTLVDYKVYNVLNPVGASKFGMMMQRDGWRKRKQAMNQGLQGLIEGSFAISITLLNILEKLASNGVRSFYEDLNQFDIDVKQQKNTSKMRLNLTNNPKFIALMSKTRQRMSLYDFSSHPKMDELLKIVKDHFTDHMNEQRTNGQDIVESTSKIMIFSNYRSSVDEIVQVLSKHSPLIRPAAFIGQANSKSKSGLKQKDQLKVISDFQQGIFNVVVATSIGEEGLDIGEIDIIICYDVHKSPIRMLQRCGRTGRKRAGQIYLLMSKGVDEDSVKKANLQYKSVQKSILNARAILYDGFLAGVLPEKIKPVCDLQNITITYQSPKKVKKKEPKSTGAFLPPDVLKIQKELYLKNYQKSEIRLDRYPHWQAQELKVMNVPHGTKSKLFVGLMEYLGELKSVEESQSPPLSFKSIPTISERLTQVKIKKRGKIKNLLDSVESESSILSFRGKKIKTPRILSSDFDSKYDKKLVELSDDEESVVPNNISDESDFDAELKTEMKKKKVYISTNIVNISDDDLEASPNRMVFEKTPSRRDLGLDTFGTTPFGADDFDFYDNDDDKIQPEVEDVVIGAQFITEDDLGIKSGLRVFVMQNVGSIKKSIGKIAYPFNSNDDLGIKAVDVVENDKIIPDYEEAESQDFKSDGDDDLDSCSKNLANEIIPKSDDDDLDETVTDADEANVSINLDDEIIPKSEGGSQSSNAIVDKVIQHHSDYGDDDFADFNISDEMDAAEVQTQKITQDLNEYIVSDAKASNELIKEQPMIESDDLYNELDSIDYDTFADLEKKCLLNMDIPVNPAVVGLAASSPISETIVMPKRRRVINDSSSPQIGTPYGREALLPMAPILERRLSNHIVLSSSPQINTKLQRTPLLQRLQQKRLPRKAPKQRTHIDISKPQPKPPKEPRFKKPKNKIAEPFMDIEAELSSNDNASSDEETEPDADLSGFIDYSSKNSPGLGLSIGFYRKSMLSPELGGMGKTTNSKFRLALPRKALQRRNSDDDKDDSSFVNDEIVYDTQFNQKDFDDDTSLLEEGPGVPVDIGHLLEEPAAVDVASEASIDEYIDDDIDLDAIEMNYIGGDVDINEMDIDDLIDL